MRQDTLACDDYRRSSGVSRRGLLFGASLAAAGLLACPKSALAQLAVRPEPKEGPTDALVVIFLRGGMDGLNAVVPYFEDNYYKSRPTIAIAAPRAGVQRDRAIDLDGRFGFHPSLAPILPLFESKELAVLHAVGSGDQTRSHFEAMSVMERGLAGGEDGAVGGWLARYLASTSRETDSPLRAVALSNVRPDSLLGATDALSLPQVESFKLAVEGEKATKWADALRHVYAGDDRLSISGTDTLDVIKRLSSVKVSVYRPANGASYPDTPVGEAMKQVALLLKAQVGVEVACVDFGGWDTHVTQGGTTGWQSGLFSELANCLAGFHKDIGERMKNVTVVVMTEFGRRIYENAGFGTDHGRGSAMLVMGGGVQGGKVVTKWPGLAAENLEGPGDLRVTTDYRSVLAEALVKRTRLNAIDDVFPGFHGRETGIFAPLA